MRQRTMRRGPLPAIMWGALMLFPVSGGAAAGDGSDAAAGLERLRSLAGHWQGENSEGQPVTLDIEVTGDGTAVMERLRVGEHHDMITLFHLDGAALMLDHYCAAGNRPVMKAAAIGPESIRFEFVEAANLSGPGAGHMHAASYIFEGPDALRAEWDWWQDGEKAGTNIITVRRTAAGN